MSATLHRPPGHQGPVAGSSASCTNSESSSAQPAQGPHSAVHDPGSLSHPHPSVFVRPLVYVQAPPPPSFLHYQWPVPSFYNPFGGIPGYGMVLPPPFLPPPYLEAPPYVLPPPQIPPVEYRRLPHQQIHSQGYQHPNQTCRTRVPQTAPVRQTMNSEVQTEPTQRGGHDIGWLPPGSDSGRGTTPNSPNSSGSRSQKEASADLENFGVSGGDADGPPKDVFTNDSSGTSDIQTCIKATREMEQESDGQTCSHDCINDQCNTSLNPPDDTDPVCCSSQKDNGVCSERHTSVPDILLNWGGSTPKSVPEKELLQKECHQTEQEKNNSVARNSTDTDDCLAVVDRCNNADGIPSDRDSEIFSKIVRFPFVFVNPLDDKLENLAGSKRPSLLFVDELESSSQKLPDCQQNDCDETFAANDTMESILSKQCFSSYWTKRKMDESVWSVESLVPFIPNKEWLLQNGLFEPEVNEMETAQNDCLTEVRKERWQSSKLFASDFNPETFFDFKILNDKQSSSKKLKFRTESHEMRPEPDQSTLEKDPLSSPTSPLSKVPSTSDEDENGSSEPETEKSPNQESFPVNVLQGDGPHSAEETLLLSSAAEKISPSGQVTPQNGTASEVEEAAEVSGGKTSEDVLSKGHLVDCGVQCDEFQDPMCVCVTQSNNLEPDQTRLFKKSEIQSLKYGKHESFCAHRNALKKQKGQKRSKAQGHGGKPEAYNGTQRSGKAKGGNGRNLQH